MKRISLVEEGKKLKTPKSVSHIILVCIWSMLMLFLCLVVLEHINAHGSDGAKKVAADHAAASEIIKAKKKVAAAAAFTTVAKTRKQLLEGMSSAELKTICDAHGLKYTSKRGNKAEFKQLLLDNDAVPLGPVAAQSSSTTAGDMHEEDCNFAGPGMVTMLLKFLV